MPAMVCPHGEAPYECRECVHRYCNADLTTLRAENARLREALRKYGRHGKSPDGRICPVPRRPYAGDCCCGLDNALKGEQS